MTLNTQLHKHTNKTGYDQTHYQRTQTQAPTHYKKMRTAYKRQVSLIMPEEQRDNSKKKKTFLKTPGKLFIFFYFFRKISYSWPFFVFSVHVSLGHLLWVCFLIHYFPFFLCYGVCFYFLFNLFISSSLHVTLPFPGLDSQARYLLSRNPSSGTFLLKVPPDHLFSVTTWVCVTSKAVQVLPDQ